MGVRDVCLERGRELGVGVGGGDGRGKEILVGDLGGEWGVNKLCTATQITF
jgi:hypothetical protein